MEAVKTAAAVAQRQVQNAWGPGLVKTSLQRTSLTCKTSVFSLQMPKSRSFRLSYGTGELMWHHSSCCCLNSLSLYATRQTSRSDFIFYADRLVGHQFCKFTHFWLFFSLLQIRLMIEQGLNCVPVSDCVIKTPTGGLVVTWLSHDLMCVIYELGEDYEGLKFKQMPCAVSIVRSGECLQTHTHIYCKVFKLCKLYFNQI